MSSIRIIATSDLHGKFVPWDYALNQESPSGSVAQLVSAVAQHRTENTLVIDVGDALQDNSADLFVDEETHPMVCAMNSVGYDVWVTGNHDYDYGIGILRKAINQLDALTLVGNLYDESGKGFAAGYHVFEFDGARVAVIGMVTPNIALWDAKHLEGWRVTNPVDECRRLIDSLAGGYDILVGAMHMGIENECSVVGSGVRDIAEGCPEFDLIIASHGHQQIVGEVINGVPIVENESHATTMMVIDFELWPHGKQFSKDGVTFSCKNVSDYPPDTNVSQELAPFDMRAREDAVSYIGRLVGGNLAPQDEIPGVAEAWIRDTALTGLIGRVMRHYTGAAVSSTALSRPDANMSAGAIRKCDTALIYKYTNMLYKVRMTGSQLRRYMEWSARFFNTHRPGDLTVSLNSDVPSYNYDVFGGVRYQIDVSCEPGSRIRGLSWPDGKPVSDDECVVLATCDYRANTLLLMPGMLFSGDDMPHLLEMDVRGELGGIRELIGDYIAHVRGGLISPECDDYWHVVCNG